MPAGPPQEHRADELQGLKVFSGRDAPAVVDGGCVVACVAGSGCRTSRSCVCSAHLPTATFPVLHPHGCVRTCRWKGDGAGRFSRTFEFVQPKKGIASAPAVCVQEQRFSVHAGGVWAMTTDMSMSGIPYGDSFRVQSFWKVRFGGGGGVWQRRA